MKRIEADPQRRVEIEGVAEPVRRPVNIDRAKTGFVKLRSLRIYRFDAGSVIDGHAEEDEVLIVVLAGAIDLTLTGSDASEIPQAATLHAVSEVPGQASAAYLPPRGAYRLIARGAADVAYARATPPTGPAPAFFRSPAIPDEAHPAVLLEEFTYPLQLRLRVTHISARDSDATVTPIQEDENFSEALIHVQTEPEEQSVAMTSQGAKPIQLASWDTVAVSPGERPAVVVPASTSVLLLTVFAA